MQNAYLLLPFATIVVTVLYACSYFLPGRHKAVSEGRPSAFARRLLPWHGAFQALLFVGMEFGAGRLMYAFDIPILRVMMFVMFVMTTLVMIDHAFAPSWSSRRRSLSNANNSAATPAGTHVV